MRTNQAYINEYAFFDQLFESLENASQEVEEAVSLYDFSQRQADLKSFFEDVTDDIDTVTESGGLLEKIGNAILKVIHSIAECIRGLTEKVFGTTDSTKKDIEKVNQILSQHPELKNEVCSGIEKEWFTYKDVAQFEKDIVGLTLMLKQNKIDHETFKDRVKKSIEKFNDSGSIIKNTSNTITSMIGIFPSIVKKNHEVKDSLQTLSNAMSDFKDDVDKNYSEKDLNKVQSIMSALSSAVGLSTKEAKKREACYSGISGILHSFANTKAGKAIKIDDQSRNDRHAKAFADREARREKDENEKRERYYKSEEEKMFRNKENQYRHQKMNDSTDEEMKKKYPDYDPKK